MAPVVVKVPWSFNAGQHEINVHGKLPDAHVLAEHHVLGVLSICDFDDQQVLKVCMLDLSIASV